MTRYYYFIYSPNDNLEKVIIYNVRCGENKRDQAQLQKLQFVTRSSTDYYFQPRSITSSNFVRALMDDFACVLTSVDISDVWRRVKNCQPRIVINLSNNYKPLSENRI